jgi:hypothetical protein
MSLVIYISPLCSGHVSPKECPGSCEGYPGKFTGSRVVELPELEGDVSGP